MDLFWLGALLGWMTGVIAGIVIFKMKYIYAIIIIPE